MGGMSGGGMGFMFDPSVKLKAQSRLQVILRETKKVYEKAVPFAMDPVVYEFRINEEGSISSLLSGEKALMSQWYYILKSPSLAQKRYFFPDHRAKKRASAPGSAIQNLALIINSWYPDCTKG